MLLCCILINIPFLANIRFYFLFFLEWLKCNLYIRMPINIMILLECSFEKNNSSSFYYSWKFLDIFVFGMLVFSNYSFDFLILSIYFFLYSKLETAYNSFFWLNYDVLFRADILYIFLSNIKPKSTSIFTYFFGNLKIFLKMHSKKFKIIPFIILQTFLSQYLKQ